jgi:hypothetical protein
MENETLVLADGSTLLVLAAGLALAMGIVGLGINYNIRRSREATEQQTRRLARELEQLRAAADSTATSEDSEARLRKDAVREALRREPELSDPKDSIARQRLSDLVDQITAELQLEREVAQVKAEEAAELRRQEADRELALRNEEAKQRDRERERKDEELRIERLKARDLRLARMSPIRRWLVTHKGLVIGTSLGILAIATLGGLMITSIVQSAQSAARVAAASSAASASSASMASASSATAEASSQAAQARLELIASCDLSQFDQAARDPQILFAWLECEEVQVALAAAEGLTRLGVSQTVSLADRDLAGADLSGMDLSRVRFDRANLVGADLSNSNLRQSLFMRTNLSEANLSGAILDRAHFTLTDLSRANLQGAALGRSIIRQSDLTEASVRNAVFGQLVWEESICPNGNKFRGDLRLRPWPC